MFGLTNIVYKVTKEGRAEAPVYRLQELYEKFTPPPKLYGSVYDNAVRIWNSFVNNTGSSGALLTGDSGAGKSLTAYTICNIALDKGLPVIYVASIEITPELVMFLSGFTDVVIYIDEYTKLVDYKTQNTILSFLSDPNYRRLFVLTENSINRISEYILNRPGRIRYHLNFEKVERVVVSEYSKDHGAKPEFVEDMLELYDRSSVFSFDHLQALVNEHKAYPGDSLEHLLNVLNLHALNSPLCVWCIKVTNSKTDELMYFKQCGSRNTNYEFRDGASIPIEIIPGGRYYINISNATKVDKNGYECEYNGFKFYLVKDARQPECVLPPKPDNQDVPPAYTDFNNPATGFIDELTY